MQVSAVDDLPEVLTLEEDDLPEASETNTVATMEKDIVVQEERGGSPAVALATTPPETSSMNHVCLSLIFADMSDCFCSQLSLSSSFQELRRRVWGQKKLCRVQKPLKGPSPLKNRPQR